MDLKLLILLAATVICIQAQQDDFACYKDTGFIKMKKENERGAIIPRSDIYVKVGGDPVQVLCRFNNEYIKAENVFFQGSSGKVIPHVVVNSSTISADITERETTEYRLACVLKKKAGQKVLCRQFVKAGYAPLDIKEENLHCRSKNYQSLNCTWSYEPNFIRTKYKVQYSVREYINETPCFTNDAATSCFWKDINFKIRDKLYLHLHGSNKFGAIEYTHLINVPEVVVPNKVPVKLELTAPTVAGISWELMSPMDVFLSGLWHQVDFRKHGENDWQLVELLSHKHNISLLRGEKKFSTEKHLPLANMLYEFRVRLHTMATDITEGLWSDFDVHSIKTQPLAPIVPPQTCLSCFEVVEKLEQRDIYINYQLVDPDFHYGDHFGYKIVAYPGFSDTELEVVKTEETNAYFKYTLMNFSEYRFKIWPKNEIGVGTEYSEVIVPNSDCMPKKTEFFTVIIRSTGTDTNSKVFSLYWVPSKKANSECPGSKKDIDTYTIFWCRKTYGERCKEKMSWTDVTGGDLVFKDFGDSTVRKTKLFEKNITGLSDNLHTFGIAAVSGKYSSGIRWSSCIVDESDSPPAPTGVSAFPRSNNTVLLKWELKCPSLSAVPLGFHIVYCQSHIPDFGHCIQPVKSIEVHSPEIKFLAINEGLEPGTSYIFSIAMLSVIGEGIQSKPVKVKTTERVPSGAPKNFRVGQVGSQSARLTWFLPDLLSRNGIITYFQFKVSPPGFSDFIVQLGPNQKEPFTYVLEDLSPYTQYDIRIAACTKIGCSSVTSDVQFSTQSAAPSPIRNFALDVSNWRLSWQLESCNSAHCEFDVRIPINETYTIEQTVKDAQFLSLYEIDLKCEVKEMTFEIRATGRDENGHPLNGNWTSSRKKARDCPPVPFAWWVILLIAAIGVLITLLLFTVAKFGWGSVKEVINRCKLKIIIPPGMELKDPNFKKHQPTIQKTSSNGYLQEDTKVEKIWPPSRPQRTASVSSEEIHLMTGISSESDRHGRNLSGSSDQSSNQDSAMSSESPTVSEPDRNRNETYLRQRITDHPYVKQSAIPEKLTEGYVAALSVPSLPQLFNGSDDNFQKSTPNLTGAKVPVLSIPGARRASTGYISMVESDGGMTSPVPPITLPPLNLSEKGGIPSYSRHSDKVDTSPKASGWPVSGYVTLAEAGGQAPITAFNMATDFKFQSEPPPGAYCKVGPQPGTNPLPPVSPDLPGPDFKSYVSVGEVNSKLNSRPHDPHKINKYIQLKDTERWAHPVPLPVEEKREVFSAPHESNLQRTPISRPYTADAPVEKKAPCLSKQSSGYVSQETLASQDLNHKDQVVVSPKRLLANGQRPQSLVIPPNAPQSSMV